MEKNDIRNASLLIAGDAVSTFGNIVLSNALNLWILQMSNNTKTLGLVASIGLLPTILFTIFGGVLSDTINKKYIIVLCDFFAAVSCFIMALIIDERNLVIHTIVIFRVIISFISAIFKPAMKSIPAHTITKDFRIKFNSYFNITSQVFQILSPIISGIMVGLGFSIKIILIIDGSTFLLSALSEVFIKMDYNSIKLNKNKESVIEKLHKGLKYIINDKYLTSIILLASVYNIFIAGYNIFLPYYSNSMGKSHYGYLLATEAIGGIIGSLSLHFNHKNLEENNIEINLLFSGILFNFFFISYSVWLLYPSVFIFGLFLSRFNIKFFTYLQNNISKDFIGRVISTTSVIALILMPVGQILFSYMMDSIGMVTFAIIGVSITLSYVLYRLIINTCVRAELK